MDGGDSSDKPAEEDQEEKVAVPLLTQPVSAGMATVETFSGTRLADAPILLLVYFHKALREEIADVRRVVVEAAEGGRCSREFFVELHRRFEFLKLVQKYHCAGEDEVFFLALDMHVENVACAYSLEHESIDGLFDAIFNSLNILMQASENTSKAFQDFLFCIGTFQSSIDQHMVKEEQQVFPLLVKQFSVEDQASLVWNFFCGVPIMLLEDFLPWMVSFLHPEEQVEIWFCLKEVVPKETLLQEVVSSWLGKYNPSSSEVSANMTKGVWDRNRFGNMTSTFWEREFKWNFGHCWNSENAYFPKINVGRHPVDGLHLWHNAIKKDLKDILEELCQMKNSSSSDIELAVVRLKFLTDVLIFYSNALETFFYPVLSNSNGYQTIFGKQFSIKCHVESLQRLLYHNAQDGFLMDNFVEKLCWNLESFVLEIDSQFALQETEVIPIIGKNFSHETQEQLLYMGIQVLPLGLLKCVITWFSAYLSEDDARIIFQSLSQQGSFVNQSLASLLLEWFRIGYSGKISVENFESDLQKTFKSRCYFLPEPIKEAAECSSLLLDMQLCKRSNPKPIERALTNKGNTGCFPSSTDFHAGNKYETPYSSGINLHISFPGKIRQLQNISESCCRKSSSGPVSDEPVPVDLIFFFHKALKKHLDELVSGSARLAENVCSLVEFHQRFHLIQFLYQIHTDAEDEIAFPALEAKGKLQNISHSYTIDHKLKVEHFSRISLTLDEITELVSSKSSFPSNILDKENVKYQQLCTNLQDMCLSMHKLLSDHIRREEIVLWPLFRECFSIEEQEKIIGCMLGRIRAEVLQDMVHWLMTSLTTEELHIMMSLWRQATKKTMFDEWLAEWWEGYSIAKVEEDSSMLHSVTPDPLEIISRYLSKEVDEQRETVCDEGINFAQSVSASLNIEPLGKSSVDHKSELYIGNEDSHECLECARLLNERDKTRQNEVVDVKLEMDNAGQLCQVAQNSRKYERLLTMSQENLEATIRRVSRDSSLNPQEKSYITQNLLMSRWIYKQQISNSEVHSPEKILGHHPSYRDSIKFTFGCEHYKRNCKLFTPCCNQFFTCTRCHDEATDHLVDRKSISKMMCMKCLQIQPVGPTCSSLSCNTLSMGKYYCRICKLFDDEREIYHCPYCNLCRLGKGLGIDYFHCMNCNACMSRSLAVHICRDKCLEDNCPICHEYIFTSSSPVKALPCGHLMHSTCFQDYTCMHYTCPICSKSLGDMQVYFGMLDALLAEEKLPDEYSRQVQDILCNDCERKGNAPFHWLYHKCSSCGSYNTRVL